MRVEQRARRSLVDRLEGKSVDEPIAYPEEEEVIGQPEDDDEDAAVADAREESEEENQ